MARMSLPPGFRFHPTDIELIMYYLKRKVMGKKLIFNAITELNIYKFDPWDLPDKCLLKNKDLEWYFFCPRAKKYAHGARSNRATENGFWKATGKDRLVTYNQRTVGSIKTLVFHRGHAPKGERTDWVMHEYRLEDKNLVDVVQDAYVLCKFFQKSGLGPKNGAQYGAPFNEEEWSDMEEIYVESPPVRCQIFSNNVPPSDINAAPERDPFTDGLPNIDVQPSIIEVCVESSAPDSRILPNYMRPGTIGSSAAMCMTAPGTSFIWSTSKPGPSTTVPLDMDIPENLLDPDLDIPAFLNMLTEDINTPPVENITNEKFDRNGILPRLDENDIYNNIGDLDDWIEMRDTGANIFTTADAASNLNPVLMGEDTSFLELNDLSAPLRFPSETGELDWIRTYSAYAANIYDMSIGREKYCSGGANVCFVEKDSGWNEYSPLLGPHFGHNLEELCKDNCIGNSEANGFDAVMGNEVPFSITEPEGSSTANQIQRRGEQQPNLQLLLESLYAHMIRAEQLIDSFPNSGSSIHFKAEVTLTVGECTKDALLHSMEESACILISWGNQPIVDVKSRRLVIAIYVILSYFEIVLAKFWILMIPATPFLFDIICSFVWSNLFIEFKWIYFYWFRCVFFLLKLNCSIFSSGIIRLYIIFDPSIVEV